MRRTPMLLSAMVLAILLAGGLALVAGTPAARADGECQPSGSEVVCTFTYTGAAQNWTIPDEVTQATFDVYGAQGGNEIRSGGLGGKARATIAVKPGETLQVNVGGAGGAGGFNGGAAGGSAAFSGGGGGGASDIRTGAFALADRIIVAGGGGGAGGDNGGEGGSGGGSEGGAGATRISQFRTNGQGGSGGSASSGGVGGGPGTVFNDANCSAGVEGTLGVGGVGGECSGNGSGGGGGGGGGYYGGGGGGGAVQGGGGGGGSGYVDPQASDVQFQSGVRGGNGLVTITYTPPDSTAPTVSSIKRASSNPTNTTGNVDWTVTFSENVTSVDTGDFGLVNGGLGGTPTISSVTQGANASVYTVTASTGTDSGTLGLNLNDDDSIADGAGNRLGGTGTGTASGGETGNGSFTGEVYTIDRAAPTVTSAAVKGPNFTDTYTADTWTNKDVRVTFTCADTGGSGLTSASGNDVQTFTTETSGTTATFSKTCKDNAGNAAAAATFGPIKIDKTAPSVSCSVTPSRLKPPNHKLVTLTASVTVTDSGSGTDLISTNRFTLVSVTSSQADRGLGPEDVPNDIQGWTTGTNDTSGQLRAERYGTARTYTLTYQGKDLAGNTKNCQATVTVPKGG